MFKSIFLSFSVFVTLAACNKDVDVKFHSKPHHLSTGLQTIMNKYIAMGIPGIQVTVLDADGWYSGGAGYANLEAKDKIKADSTTWIFSITKTYTAALVMMSRDKNLLNLDKSIANYLPVNAISAIKNSNRITVRQLLNHSSGIVNFIELPEYLQWQFTDPLHQPSVSDILEMVRGKDVMFEPGADSYYSNTNYLLLGLILEKVNGKPYVELLRSEILTQLHLSHTLIQPTPSIMQLLGFPQYFADLDASGQLHNVSPWNNALGQASLGWGGIAARPSDVVRFYRALVSGKLVSLSSLTEMQQYKGDYGLGIEAYMYSDGRTQFGHEGDGVGNSTMILYIPKSNAFVFINCTVGRQLPTPYLQKIVELKNEVNEFVIKSAK